MLKIAVREIRDAGLELDGNMTTPGIPEMVRSALGNSDGKTRMDYHMDFNRFHSEILINGNIQYSYNQICSRCAEEFTHTGNDNFKLVLNLETPPQFSMTTDLSASDLDTTYLEGDAIDGIEILREQLVLSIPLQPLCSENCKGKCHECGRNLNTDKCTCQHENFNPKFAVLKNFKVKNKPRGE